MTRVLFRAKSGASVGEGHVVRSRAVAEAVAERGGEVAFVVDEPAGAERLSAEGFEAWAACDFPGWTGLPAQAAWIDGFADWTEELRALRRRGTRTILVENRTPAREWCDRLVYPALHWCPDAWDRVHAARVLGGADWIPLRRGVRTALPALQRDVDVLITFGGSDPKRLTERTLAALPPGRGHVAVSVGVHMEARRPELERLAEGTGAERVTLLPTGADLDPWMSRGRVALTALGTTLYELAHLDVPALVLANWPDDRGPLEHYGVHGPHLPLGLADELDDAALATALSAALGELDHTPPPAFPDLAAGANRLADLLLTSVARVA